MERNLKKVFRIRECLDILQILQIEGFDVSKIRPQIRTGTDGKRCIQLIDVQQKGLDIHKVIEKYQLNPSFPLGSNLLRIRSKYNQGRLSSSDEIDALKLEVISCKRKTKGRELLDILYVLQHEGIDINTMQVTKSENGKSRFIRIQDIQQPNIDIGGIIKKYQLDGNYAIGRSISNAISTYYGKNAIKMTKDEMQELKNLLPFLRRSRIEVILDVLEYLNRKGYEVAKIRAQIGGAGKQKYTKLSDLCNCEQETIKIASECGIQPTYGLGREIAHLREEYKKGTLTNEEEERAEKAGGIRLKTIACKQEILRKKLEQAMELSRRCDFKQPKER